MQTITAQYAHPLSESESYPHLIVRQSNHQSNIYHKSSVFRPFASTKRPFILITPWAGIYFALNGSSPILAGKRQTAQSTK